MKLSIITLIGFIIAINSGETYAQLNQANPVSENGGTRATNPELPEMDLKREKVLKIATEEEKGFLHYRDQMTGTLKETLKKREIKEEFSFNPIKSINGNIKFGGFYNNKVDLYFAPQMYIKPFDWIGIYAIRQKHVYIPIEEIKENIKPLAIETAGLVIIENVVNFFTLNDKLINGILNFALKNGFTFLMQSLEDENKKLPKWEYYYCSIGIRF